jgi:hypothetical protein
MSAFRPPGLESAFARVDECMYRGQSVPATATNEVTMKARSYRIFGSLTVLSVLTAILAAPKKWG